MKANKDDGVVGVEDAGVVEVKVRVLLGRRITKKDGGRALNRSDKTMTHWAAKGWGPRPIRVGGRIFYDLDEVLAMAKGEKPIKPSIKVAA